MRACTGATDHAARNSSQTDAQNAAKPGERGGLLMPTPDNSSTGVGRDSPSSNSDSHSDSASIAAVAEPGPQNFAIKTDSPIESKGNGDVAAMVARAELAEKRALKAEAEVRKLRAELHTARTQKASEEERATKAEMLAQSTHSAELWAIKTAAEERAVKAETENLHLHCEVQALRAAILGDAHAPTSPPPPPPVRPESLPDTKSPTLSSFQYLVGCPWRAVAKCRQVLLCIPCRRNRRSRDVCASPSDSGSGDSTLTPVVEIHADDP